MGGFIKLSLFSLKDPPQEVASYAASGASSSDSQDSSTVLGTITVWGLTAIDLACT
ncbi:MAG: hypothetical protein OJF51_005032 [Nitrospira sp.]|nr:MAG: hypothetical protein OJF51_005032 [Nitrospira sp.]